MKKMKYFLKSTSVLFLVASIFFSPATPSVSAKGISIPSPSQVASELENRYHINLGSVQNQSELFNVANQKKTVPETSLFFSPSDPKSGQKVTASALPSFFSNEKENLYFSWYLKRADCDIDSSPSAAVRAKCDADNNGRINVNDWKVEAMRALALNGFDNTETTYGSDSDSDGYRARFGGDNKVGVTNRCAAYDSASGNIYEIGIASSSSFSGVCGSGLTPVCMTPRDEVEAGSFSSGDGSPFTVTTSTTCDLSGYPTCSGGTVTCSSGTLSCVAEPYATSCGSSALSTSCSVTSSTGFTSQCQHLFPQVSGQTSGDGSFGSDEERFWGTNPNDPDTADNNNKDEANIVGLGQDTFSWTYDSGDKVGLAIEGTSMITTKHDDSSSYVMWAFSKNNCPISIAENTGSYSESVRGYSVPFSTAEVDLNDCLERNLVDPVEGGQPTRMEVSVSADPENPVNDESGDITGDIVTAYATVTNGDESKGQFFDWTVSIANNIQFDNSGSGRRSNDVTDELKDEKMLSFTRGSGLSSLSLGMNMPTTWKNGLRLADYVNSDGVGYIRFAVTVSENFATDVARKGRGDVVVKFQTIRDRIGAYRVTASPESLKLSFQNADEICNDNLFRRAICPVVKNEIVGLKIGSSGFTDYRWTVNGRPLLCSDKLSSQCSSEAATDVTFLPIFGEIDDTFTVSVDAMDVVSGKRATLSRIFRIVDPAVEIVSADTNQTWPKFLGQYKDASGKLYSDLSRNIFQVFGSGTLRLKPSFMPPFLQTGTSGIWTVNGETVTANTLGEIDIPVDTVSGIYNVNFQASTIQSPAIRQALQTHWNISVFDSGEEHFSKSVQVEVVQSEDEEIVAGGFLPGSKAFAALASYIPASVLFTIKAFFSMALILIISGFMMALVPVTSAGRRG